MPIRNLWQRNGRFYGQLNINGKQTKIPLTDCHTVAQASDKLLELRRDIKSGKYKPKVEVPTLKNYREHYLKHVHKSPKTMQNEAYFLDDWVTYLGDGIRLDEITPTKILHYRSKQLADGLSARTANLRLVALKNLFKLAKTEGLVDSLPMDGIKQLKYTAPQKVLLEPEVIDKAMTAAMECCPRSGSQFVDYIYLLAYSGMRETECLGLRWENVDFSNRWIAIPALLTKNQKPRYINFSDQLEAHLKAMHERRKNDWLFPSPRSDGHVTNYKSTLMKVREKSGVYLSEHLMRHYFISKCVMKGLDFMTIARWAGHQDGGILIGRVYGHLNSAHMVQAAKRLTGL